jgi:lipoyl(octanoyl) transferase
MVHWHVSTGLVPYADAVEAMEARVDAILRGAPEAVWLLEHPPLYTAGTSARPADLRDPGRFPVHETRRGGQHTYHGPGQRVAYVMLDLSRRGRDVRAHVRGLEAWVVQTLAAFAVTARTDPARVGVWVPRPERAALACGTPREDKVAAIGVRVRRWVAFHGVAINVEPDLSHFEGIVPCGIEGHGVTSLVDLGLPVTMDDLDAALLDTFPRIFGDVPRRCAGSPQAVAASVSEA